MAPVLPVLRDARVTLRPQREEDLDGLMAVLAMEGVREWWSPIEDPEEDREELRNDGWAFTIEVAGELAGWLGISEVADPDYRSAGLDIVLSPPHQDRGLGSAALRLAIGWLIERGHHRFTIDPSARNKRAIRAYSAVGFRPVGVMRRYERGPDGTYHDGLLMDLMAEELRSASSA